MVSARAVGVCKAMALAPARPGVIRQIAVNLRNDGSAIANGGSDAFGRPCSDVADCKDARLIGLQCSENLAGIVPA